MPMKGEMNMLNLASVLEVADFTPKELETLKKHVENNAEISFNNMVDAWRDEQGVLCVSFSIGRWWHYSENGTWW